MSLSVLFLVVGLGLIVWGVVEALTQPMTVGIWGYADGKAFRLRKDGVVEERKVIDIGFVTLWHWRRTKKYRKDRPRWHRGHIPFKVDGGWK